MCLGIARGLEYLHEHRKLNIAHMNIKAVNILLDGDLNPKISDFGLAHLYVEEDQFKVIKSDVLQGYTAPEYFHGNFSSKGDVYSFGVILLEIVCWKKNVIKSHHGTEVLVDKANEIHERGKLEDMIDKTLQGVDTKQALTILQLAVKCTNIAPSVRPTMSQVVSVLLDKMKIDELFRPAPPNVGEKIKGTRDLASVDATSMEHTPMPSTSSPSPKTKDELESTGGIFMLGRISNGHRRASRPESGLSPPSPPRQHISQQLVCSLSQSSTSSQSQRMKGLFKSKPRTPADVVRQTRDLLIYAQRGGTDSRESKREEKMAELSKNIRELKCILYGNSESEPVSEACAQLTQEFFREDTLRLLITCLPKLNLEARKDATQVVANLQRQQIHSKLIASDYLEANIDLMDVLIQGYGDTDMALHYGAMLRECIRHQSVARYVLESQHMKKFFDYIQLPNFDIAADAAATFKELMTRHKSTVADFLSKNYDWFFAEYNSKLLESTNYITRRQAVKLLGDILLDRSNSAVMTRYVSSRDNLRILMNLLRESSKSIQIEAFHVFKLFVANQNKPAGIVGILVANRSKLLRLFADFKIDKEDEQFEADKVQVVREIAALEPKE
ncbi:hypothetical protein ACLB2K_033314 [Fragaria x ananassa]